jgi:hypothetical protein
MNVRALARVCGLLGGACWAVRLVLGGEPGDAFYWAGLALLFVGLFGLGTALVSKEALWLQVIVGVALSLLVWSVVEVVHASGDPVAIDAVAGILIGVTCLLALGRQRRGDKSSTRRHAGAHAR